MESVVNDHCVDYFQGGQQMSKIELAVGCTEEARSGSARICPENVTPAPAARPRADPAAAANCSAQAH